MKKTIIIIIGAIIVLIITFVAWFGLNFTPGSYPYAEMYEVKTDESTLIGAIQDFKKNNPDYDIPEETQLHDGRNDSLDHWYHVYFYFPNEDIIVYSWTRPSGKGKTTLAFVSINKGLVLGNWKDINKGLDKEENEYLKAKFKERILNPICETW